MQMLSVSNLLITGGVGTAGKAIALKTSGKHSEFISIDGGEIYGIATHAGFRFVAVRGESPCILRMNTAFVVDKRVQLPAADPHCIYIKNGIVHLVSSSEDAIHKFDLDLNRVGLDLFGLGGDNRFHVNDVTHVGSRLFVSMFTDKADENWDADEAQGLVKVGTQIDPVRMTLVVSGLVKPHSPVIFNDDLWVADSGRGAIWCNTIKMFQEVGTWTRGLCVDGNYIHAGVADRARVKPARIVTFARSGDIVREVEIPLTYVYGIQIL